MNRYIPKTLLITPEQEIQVAEWIKRFRKHHLEMSLSSIVRLLLEEHLDTECRKFPFFKDERQMELKLEGGND